MIFSKFMTLKNKIFFFFIILLLLVQFLVFWTIRVATTAQEENRLASDLYSASLIFQTIFSSSHNSLNDINEISNNILRENFSDDRRSFLITLENFRIRVKADLAMAIDKDGMIKAQIVQQLSTDGVLKTRIGQQQGNKFTYSNNWLADKANPKFYQLNNQIYQFSISESKVGAETIGWIGFGNKIDNNLAKDFYQLNNFHIDFLLTNSSDCQLIATSQQSSNTTNLNQNQCSTPSDDYLVSEPIILGKLNQQDISVILYKTREDILSSIQERWVLITVLSSLTVLLSSFGAYLLAAFISKPVQQLVKQAKHISQGHYNDSIQIDDGGELGQLANEFNLMQSAVLEREQRLMHNSYHHALTNLPNRTALFQKMENWLKDEYQHAIFLIKLNHIRDINETLGHDLGDQMIKIVGKRLQAINQVTFLSHLRADEFVLLVDDKSNISIISWIDKIAQVLEAPFSTQGMNLHLQTNIGVAICSDESRTADKLLKMADSALQQARQQKQLFKLYDKSLDDVQAGRLIVINDLHTAIAENQFELFYQPKLDVSSGKIKTVEALIRWMHPEKGMIPPDKFIPIAENTGQIDNITIWVLEEAARQFSIWKKQDFDIKIAVNISAQNLKSTHIYDSLMFVLEQYNLDIDALQLEVTESAVVDDPETAIAILSKFKDAGVKLSIDDYGTGYSSLAQLKQLPVHELKIDMTFIRKLPDDEDDKIIVKSTIELAHSMGLSVVAEGVENEKALNWLADHGCEIIQGYYISRPLPAEAFMEWFQQSNYC